MQTGSTENPKLAVFNSEDILRERLQKLGGIVDRIREELLGPEPQGKTEEAKKPEAGFFSVITDRLSKDIDIVNAITNVAHDVQRSLGNPETVTPNR
ncbi:MAG: hypothetical protein IMF11_20185 [Proteobacteria bacterium]|nr:hypothetical protein [Pseudomonadota bacterium]